MNAARTEKTTLLLLACCILQIAACVHYWLSYQTTGYLPAPFIYDKSDTFMDLFNPMFWADDNGRYTVWGSVYPPLNFLLLKLIRWLMLGPLDGIDGFDLRGKTTSTMIIALIAFYAMSTLFVMRNDLWKDFNGAQKGLLTVCFMLSPPVLFTIERGNLIIFALGFLALAMARPGWARILAIAILINLKPYFALFLLALALTHRLREMFACVLAAGVIFLLTGILLDVNFWTFIPNLLQFSQDEGLFSAREMLAMPSSVSAFAYVLRVYFNQGGTISIAGYDIGAMISIIEAVKWLGIGSMFAALALVGRRIPTEIAFAAMTVTISNLGVWVGGYSFIFYIALIPAFLRMKHAAFYLACVALVLLPIDIVALFHDNIGEQVSYASGTAVSVDWALTLGALLRPMLNFALMIAICYEIAEFYVRSRQHPFFAIERSLLAPFASWRVTPQSSKARGS